MAVLYWTTVLGVTLGLHRLLAHRSFVAPKWLERTLVLMGSLACQSGPIEWVGCTATTTNSLTSPTITTTPAAVCGGATATGCCTTSQPFARSSASPATCSATPSTAGWTAGS